MAQDLACKRGERLIFAGISFTLDPGEALVLTGRNGAGKSSLIGLILGQIAPAAGQILLTGDAERPIGESCHHLGHRDGLKGRLTALENLDFARTILGDPRLEARAALAVVGLEGAGDIPAGYLSAGQKRRVALARLLVSARPLWLLDEPTAALDAPSQAILSRMMQAHLRGGGLIVAATHQPLDLPGSRQITLGAASHSGESA